MADPKTGRGVRDSEAGHEGFVEARGKKEKSGICFRETAARATIGDPGSGSERTTQSNTFKVHDQAEGGKLEQRHFGKLH